MTRTRTRLALVGIALLLVASGVPPHTETATAAEHTFVVEQGNRCFEVSPLDGSQNVVSFYDYRNPENSGEYTYSSYMPRHLTAEDVSRLFLYDGPNGVSLVIVHNQRGGDRGDGSAGTFRFGGLPNGGNWVVMDDDYAGRDDRFSRNRIDWSWYGDRTDGAVFRGLDYGGTEVTIDPAFDQRAALYDSPVDRTGNTRAWQFLTGSLSSPSAVGLDMTRPITIRTGYCGPDETPPSAGLSASDGVAGFPVSFDATGSSDNRGIAEYRWDFDGDGTPERTTNDPTVGYTYDEPGTYNATVTVVDSGDNADSATVRVAIDPDEPPSASFETGESPTAGFPVSFDASESADDVGIAEYRWDFDGDGAPERTTNSPTVGYTYDEPGTHEVGLTVVDSGGQNDTVSRTVSIDNDDPPEPAIEVVSPEMPVEGERVVLDASNSTDDTGIVEYRWSLGDNTTATGERAAYTYPENGTYTVTLEAVDEGGNNATATLDLEILPPDETPPDAAVAGAERKRVEAGANVTLDASPSSDDRTVESYRWEFGDGSGASGQRATHAYGQQGVYNATVFVTDGGGNTANATVTVEVFGAQEPNVSATVPETVTAGETFSVEGSATDNGEVAEYRWNFGGAARATGQQATHAFEESGNFTVTLTAVDRAGNSNTTSARVEVLPPDATPPNASLSVGTNETRAGDSIQFDANGSSDDRGIAEYRWDFDGDGEIDRTTDSATVSKEYGSKGTYNATVTVADGGNNTDSATVSIRVEENEQAHGGGGDSGGNGALTTGPPPVVTDPEKVGANESAIDVRNGRADERVRTSVPKSEAAAETGVRFREVGVDLARDDSHFVVETDRSVEGSSPADATLGSLAVGAKYLDASDVEGVAYEVAVRESRLAEAGLEPGDLVVYQRTEGEWERVDTAVETGDEAVVLRAETDALAPIAVGADVPARLADAELASEQVAADEPVAVTVAVENEGNDAEEFAANLTVDGEVVATKTVEVAGGATEEVTFERPLDPGTHAVGVNGEQVGSVTVEEREPDLGVADVSLNASTVSAGERVEITATVENAGGKPGERELALTLFGEELATKTVEVPAGETKRVTFVRQVEAPGNYTVEVGGASAELEVTGEDGENSEGETSGPEDPGVPGFGVGAALVALVAAMLLVRLRRSR